MQADVGGLSESVITVSVYCKAVVINKSSVVVNRGK